MKKIIILTSLLAAFAMANAQTTYHVVYIPGDGERQFGFSLAPSFCGQHLNVNTQYGSVYTGTSYTSENTVNNYVGFNAGLFYGYETVWGNFIEWGNYTSLYYGVNPFSGNVDISHNGTIEQHDVQYTMQRVTLHVNPFISHRFNDQFSISAGIGISLSPILPSKIKFDGQVLERNQEIDEFLFMNILNFNFDANLGVKYWMTDEWYVGLRVEYAFANLLDIFGKDKETDDILADCNGSITIYMDDNTAKSTILGKRYVQTVFSIGYTW